MRWREAALLSFSALCLLGGPNVSQFYQANGWLAIRNNKPWAEAQMRKVYEDLGPYGTILYAAGTPGREVSFSLNDASDVPQKEDEGEREYKPNKVYPF